MPGFFTFSTTPQPRARSCRRRLRLILSPELAGSELFGHERGAFTGAIAARDGAFALADGGTLMLDEIGELPVPLQAQLLRAIQEHTYKRVGGNVWRNSEFRLICATNRDLEQGVRDGTFRADLYYRLADWMLRPPPLRERREDIPLLVRHFLEHAANGGSKSRDRPLACRLSPPAATIPATYGTPQAVIVMRLHARHVGPGPITIGALPADDRPESARIVEPWAEPGFLLALQRALDSRLRAQRNRPGRRQCRGTHLARAGEWQSPARGETLGRDGPRVADATRQPWRPYLGLGTPFPQCRPACCRRMRAICFCSLTTERFESGCLRESRPGRWDSD